MSVFFIKLLLYCIVLYCMNTRCTNDTSAPVYTSSQNGHSEVVAW